MKKEKKTIPAAITIFGAKGDLTRRKLIPALYNLYADNHLPADFSTSEAERTGREVVEQVRSLLT